MDLSDTVGLDRRVLGAAVLALALMTAVILPVIDGRSVAGIPVRSAEPVVGDCVLVSGVIQVLGDGGSTRGILGRPSAVRTDCVTPGAATVIGRSAGAERMPETLTRREYLGYRSGCRGAVEQARLNYRGDRYSRPSGGSRVTFGSLVLLAAEAATPQIDGHIGDGGDLCYAMAPAGDVFVPTMIPADRPGDALGVCQLRVPAEQDRGASTSCRDPHDIESFGRVIAVTTPDSGTLSNTNHGTNNDTNNDTNHGTNHGTNNDTNSGDIDTEVASACRDYLALVTGMSDPTVAGQLRVAVRSAAVPSGSVAGEPSRPAEAARGSGVDSVCGLVVTERGRTLAGSLVDLGDRPLPWG